MAKAGQEYDRETLFLLGLVGLIVPSLLNESGALDELKAVASVSVFDLLYSVSPTNAVSPNCVSINKWRKISCFISPSFQLKFNCKF